MNKLVFCIFLIFTLGACSSSDWRTASRAPAGIAYDPSLVHDAIVEVYAADAFSWRGWFAVHTWIAIKEPNVEQYTVFEVVGWRTPTVRRQTTKTPDRYWYGAKPEKVLSIVGEKAELMLPKIKAAVDAYPYANEYTVFPGPNSNTFTAWVGKQVPEMELDLPFSAIGSGYVE
ncbi:DUF3750 domain-containing protein [Alteromonas sediminis]|nr:DUF3750 domain-containing protein [Alteromonas sediminis]